MLVVLLKLMVDKKIFSALYYSFNVLGLSIILVVGTVMIALDLSIESIVSCIDKRRKHPRHTYSRLEWHATSTLQLQRLAHEELGIGAWERCTNEVPVTEYGELLGLLDLSDESHPRLMRADEGRAGEEARVVEDSQEKARVAVAECAGSEQRASCSSQ